MPVCGWCGKFDKKVEAVDNGATTLHLCPFCFAQYELKQNKIIVPEDFSRPGLMERIQRWLFRR